MAENNKIWKAGALRSPASIEKRREHDRQRRRKQHAYGARVLRRYKLMKGCRKCGYKKHHAGLQFNHINPVNKSFDVGRGSKHKIYLSNKSKAKQLLKNEILNKCEVLCATCHSIVTYEEKHYKKRDKE
tara:strand:- start:113 stop:499 length:387 start_codon:yes stop_codon:yes gene_type:complete